jgi:hypothetical protein
MLTIAVPYLNSIATIKTCFYLSQMSLLITLRLPFRLPAAILSILATIKTIKRDFGTTADDEQKWYLDSERVF